MYLCGQNDQFIVGWINQFIDSNWLRVQNERVYIGIHLWWIIKYQIRSTFFYQLHKFAWRFRDQKITFFPRAIVIIFIHHLYSFMSHVAIVFETQVFCFSDFIFSNDIKSKSRSNNQKSPKKCAFQFTSWTHKLIAQND